MLTFFEILYPTEALVRTALRGAAAYQLAWYDAHMWAYADHYGLAELPVRRLPARPPLRHRPRVNPFL